MSRFKTSKYRNAADKPAKREGWYLDINVGNLKLSCGNHIKASTSHMAFNVELGGGGSLAILALENIGRRDKAPPLLHCHADFVTDMDFSPFDGRHLATCSYDCSIKLWQLPENGIQETPTSPLVTLPQQPGRVENVLFHPSASEVLASSCLNTVTVWDLEQNQQKYELSCHNDLVLSLSWKQDGSLLATSSKDKKIRIFDPRTSTCTGEANGLGSIKDSRVMWLGDRNQILGTGFSASRDRQVAVWDIHNLNSPLEYISVDSSTGIFMPFYDADTDMLLIAGKGDSSISYFEVKEGGSPYLKQVSVHMTEGQTRGMAMVPKLALDVMSCEVVRLLQVTQHAIVPISFCVPRKNNKEYQEDLYPETLGNQPGMTGQQWFDGQNTLMERVNLNPSKKSLTKPTLPSKPELAPQEKPFFAAKPTAPAANITKKPEATPSKEQMQVKESTSSIKRIFSVTKSSKFRHIQGVPVHKKNNIENIRNLSLSTFGECDGLQVNKEFVAWLVAGPGGQIAVHQLTKPCRLQDAGLPVIQCGSTVMDYVFDPFNDHRIAAACETAVISIWEIPKGGLTEIIDEPITELRGHTDKPVIVRYHPVAINLLASTSVDLSIKLWDIEEAECIITLQGHQELIFSFAWSLDGKYLASVSRDKQIRIYDPRASTTFTMIGEGPEGSRGARILWAGPNSELVVISGFDKSSARKVSVYSASDLSKPLSSLSVNAAPSILIPHYDQDTGVIMLSGKGDTTIYGIEVSSDSPYIFELSSYNTVTPFQAVSFLDKRACNVKEVEIARAVKMTKTNIEQIQFKIPRIKLEFFQDDIFPDATITWEPALTCKEWFAGENKELKKMNLRPVDMKALSDAPKAAPVAKKYDSSQELDDYKSDEQKKEMLVTAMVNKLGNFDEDPLPQDMMEGVEDDEWDD